MRKRKFYKDTSLPKDGSDLVMDYDMGDLIQEVRSYRNATEELEFEDITSRQQSDRQQDDIDEWLSSKKSSRRPSDSENYISNRQLYDSEINGTDISYSDRNRNTHSNTNSVTKVRAENPMERIGTMTALGGSIGAISATIFCLINIGKHKQVKIANSAGIYLDENNVEITRSEDVFVRSEIKKIRRN
jgi:hypothetical protein